MRHLLPLIALTAVLVLSRVLAAHEITTLANLQALGALFFCCTAYHRKALLWIPALAWAGTYAYTSTVQGYGWGAHVFIVATGVLALIGMGQLFRERKAGQVFGGSLLAAVAFYLITNSLSWLLEPAYAKSPTGYLQAIWTGLPEYPPTWLFFRNSLVSMALFSGLFILAHRQLAPAPARKQALVSPAL